MDIIAILIASLVLVPLVVFTGGPLRVVLGLLFVLFFPGYALIATLFPRKQRLGGMERIGLSFGLSIVVTPLIGLLCNYSPWGITVNSMLYSLLVFILAMCCVTWYRRRRLAESERFTVPFKLTLPLWKSKSVPDKILSLLLVLAVVGAAGTLGYVIAAPKMGEHFTEFYVLGSGGKAEGYPRYLGLDEKGEVILGVTNRENQKMNYQVRVTINGREELVRVWLEDKDREDTLLADNTINIERLAHDEKWERKLFFKPLEEGKNQRVEFLLLSSKLRENHHIYSQLGSEILVDMEIAEAEGKGKITIENKSGNRQSYDEYKLEIWQEGAIQRELGLTLSGAERLEKEFQFPPGKSIFQLYENDRLVLKDTGANRSLYLWVDVS